MAEKPANIPASPRPDFLPAALVFLSSLLIRVLPVFSYVFPRGTIRLQGMDAWYHLRLIEHTAQNFPSYLLFDPYRNRSLVRAVARMGKSFILVQIVEDFESSSYNLEIVSGTHGDISASRTVYYDSIDVGTATYAFGPAPVSLNGPSHNATGQNSPLYFYWGSVSGAIKYQLEISTDSTFSTGILVSDSSLTGTSVYVSIPPLLYSTRHFWRVRGQNSAGWGEWSSYRAFNTLNPPGTPTTYNPYHLDVETSTSDISFGWSFVSGATGYHIQVATDSAFTSIVSQDSTLTGTSHDVFFPPLSYNST